MPKEVVEAVANKIRKTGKWPTVCDRSEQSPDQCGERIAGIVVEKRKLAKAGHGGSGDPQPETWATYSQYFDEAMAIEDTDGGVWLKIADHDAKLRNPITNEMFGIDQTAWMASIGFWASPLYESGKNAILANIDHKKNTKLSREEFDFVEAKYAWDDGAYVKVMPTDDELRSSLLDGTVRPSPEVIRVDEDDSKTAQVIRPTGLGLMWEGDALSPGAGAQAPPEGAVTLAGGTDMDDGNEGGDTGGEPDPVKVLADARVLVEKADADAKAAADAKAKDNANLTDVEKLQAEMATMKAQYEAEKTANETLMGKEKLEKDELLKAKAELEVRNKTNDDRERKALVKKIEKFDKEYPNKEGDLDVIRRDLYFFEKVSKQFENVNVNGPDFSEQDNFGLEDMEKMFEEGKDLEQKVFHTREFSRPPSDVFKSGDE